MMKSKGSERNDIKMKGEWQKEYKDVSDTPKSRKRNKNINETPSTHQFCQSIYHKKSISKKKEREER